MKHLVKSFESEFQAIEPELQADFIKEVNLFANEVIGWVQGKLTTQLSTPQSVD